MDLGPFIFLNPDLAMPDYPILLQLKNRLCVVVGGGTVGLRKVRSLLEAGARVRLVCEAAVDAAQLGEVEIVPRAYRQGDLEGAFLVFAATDSRAVNAAVVAEARALGALVNVADAPDAGDFTLPARLCRGELTVSVSTAGRSPALAAVLRDRLAERLGPEWATVLEITGSLRRKRLTEAEKTEYNQAILHRLLDGGLSALIARGDIAGIDHLLETLFGEGFSLAELGIQLPKETT